MVSDKRSRRVNKFFVTVSQTENPLDNWYGYWWDAVAHDGTPNDTVYRPGDTSDYPSLGIGSFGIYQTNGVSKFELIGDPGIDATNYDPNCPPYYRHWHVIFFPAGPLASGLPSVDGWQYWDLTSPDGTPTGRIQPVVHHGPSQHAYFVSRYRSDQLLICGLSDPLEPTQRIGRVAAQLASPFQGPRDAPQKDSSRLISMTNLGTDTLKAVYRNTLLYLTTNDGRDWFGDGQVLTSVRLVRLNMGDYPNSIPTIPETGFINRVLMAKCSNALKAQDSEEVSDS